MRSVPKPRSRGLSEKPNPGIDGITTSNESSARPPKVTGSVSGPITLLYSSMVLGHPFSNSSGSEPGFFERMNEVNVEAVDVGLELREPVEAALLRAPVEAVAPVGNQFFEVAGVNSVVPAHAGQFVRKPCVRQP